MAKSYPRETQIGLLAALDTPKLEINAAKVDDCTLGFVLTGYFLARNLH